MAARPPPRDNDVTKSLQILINDVIIALDKECKWLGSAGDSEDLVP